ncbi:hypothetical protein L3X38_033494 [Prunus dulcis]|uniref:Uncharacterized protein n=1 Tax=Prunus dulcis TaxID=3755 RepID=A0AAD4VI65_PRUDU|nr:hypothetical protein L3X38_033494 [Prunus dulcis]
METIVILVCYNGKWVTSKKMCKYEGGDSKGLIVPRTIKFAELLDRVHQIDSSRMGHSLVAIVESNEVTWNNTNVTNLGGEVGTDFMDMIDFSEVEEMHGDDKCQCTLPLLIWAA